QFRNDRTMRAETLEQPDQDQLRVRIRIDPQIDRIETIADISQAERCKRGERLRKFGLRQQWSGSEAVADTDHLVGDTGYLEASSTGVAGRQDKALHRSHCLAGGINTHTTKRAPKTSATQRPRRPLWSNPRSIDPGSQKTHSSAGSSPSASRSGVPARICSEIRPEFCRIEASILAVMSGLAFKNAFEFSRPCPSRWLSYENQAPDFSTMPALTPRSRISPILETPSPYMMSNSTCLNGGASLFFTTLTRVVLPTTSSRSLIAPMRRMSRRTEA